MIPYGAIIQMAMGAIQTATAKNQVSELGDYEKFHVAPEVQESYDYSRTRMRQPFTPSSNAAFESQMGSYSNLAYNQAVSQDPSLAGVVRGAANNKILGARTNRALAGDDLAAKYFGVSAQLASQFQSSQDKQTESVNSRLLEEERALGKAVSDNKLNTAEGAAGTMQGGSDVFQDFFGGAMKGDYSKFKKEDKAEDGYSFTEWEGF